MPYANNKDADQPEHPCSLSHCLDSIIINSSISVIPGLKLATAAKLAGLSLIWYHIK